MYSSDVTYHSIGDKQCHRVNVENLYVVNCVILYIVYFYVLYLHKEMHSTRRYSRPLYITITDGKRTDIKNGRCHGRQTRHS